MTPDQHVTVAIILAALLTAVGLAYAWMRWDDWRRIK